MSAVVDAEHRGVDTMWTAAVAFADRALVRLGQAPGGGDAVRLLAERHPDRSMTSVGRISVGGACHLFRAGDGWIAVHLPRPDDLELLPAWLGIEAQGVVPWAAIADALETRDCAEVVDTAQELGLAVAAIPEPDASPDAQLGARNTLDVRRPFVRTTVGPAVAPRSLDGLHVVDLSSLWAGPLCARLMQQHGARVTKVESTSRPDGARLGDAAFFEAMHAGREFVGIPFDRPEGVERLRALLVTADVVIEASRPRALERLGIDPADVLAAHPGAVWVSITAYGRTGPWRDRVGFGDDAAAAGGLVGRDAHGVPNLVGDAIADPLTGILAAALVRDSVARGGGEQLDVALREVARAAAAGAEVRW